MDPNDIYTQVNKRYGSINKSKSGAYESTVARAFGYTEEELAHIPEGANLGVSCGNPLALAKLKEGETVIDLGCGAGFDVFNAATKVGLGGQAIGVDMNTKMLAKANENKSKINDGSAKNIHFIASNITAIPLPDASADCIISNCVINLVPAPEKHLVFAEMFRLLKPGGRVAISDILARRPFTDEIRRDVALYVGCVAGASQVGEYELFLEDAGFEHVLIVDTKSNLNIYLTADEGNNNTCCGGKISTKKPSCCSADTRESSDQPGEKETSYATDSVTGTPSDHQAPTRPGVADSFSTHGALDDLNVWAGSFQVYAIKPQATG